MICYIVQKVKILLLGCILFPLFIYGNGVVDSNRHFTQFQNSFTDTTYTIIDCLDKTYGYEILVDSKVIIRQRTIPGLSGLKGFKRRSDAIKVAKLVIDKLKNGIMPPSVEKNEMEKLKVKF